MQHYIYDAGGERVLKARSLTTAVYVNGTLQNNTITMDNYTTYPNGFIGVDPTGVYSKHYYMGSQRIASRVGDTYTFTAQTKSAETSAMADLKTKQQKDLLYYATLAGHKEVEYKEYKASSLSDITAEDNNTKSATATATISIYYYHPDHLGTNTLLTDISGNAYQLFLNLPFGESMAEQSSSGYYQSPYKFNGKELDAETGLYYYGARYYDPKSSVWLSVDPLADYYPFTTPYGYCLNNPIKFIDPDGNKVVAPDEASKQILLKSLNFMFGKDHGFSFNGDNLISNGKIPSGLTAGQQVMFNYFNNVLVNSNDITTIKANKNADVLNNGDGSHVFVKVGEAVAKTFGISSFHYRIGDYVLTKDGQNLILIPSDAVKNGTSVITKGGTKLIGVDHILSHEIGHAIVYNIMNSFGGVFNGVDFNIMNPDERDAWAIRFTNTLFKGQQIETGTGQHQFKGNETPPSSYVVPIDK